MKHTVTEHKLSHGTQGLLIDVPGSDVYNILVRFNSGYQFADQATYELPHVMEHLMSTRSQKYPQKNQFFIEAQKNGAYANAHTSPDFNSYVYECADFELDRILDLLEEQLIRPLFTQADLDIERSNVREELSRNTTDHQRICSLALSEQAFPGQSLNFDTRMSQLDTIGLEAIKQYYTYAFTAVNARFYVAGPVAGKSDALVERFERLFAQLSPGKPFVTNGAVGLDIPRPILQHKDISQLYYRASVFSGQLSLTERHALTMLRLLLVGGMGSRVMGEARSRGLAYGVGMSVGSSRGNSEFGFTGYVTPKNAHDLFKVMVRHTADIVADGLTTAELEAAQTLGIGTTKRSYQTSSDMLGWYVGPYEDDRSINHFEAYLDALQKITVADVRFVAAKVTGTAKHGVSFVGDISVDTAQELAMILEPLWLER